MYDLKRELLSKSVLGAISTFALLGVFLAVSVVNITIRSEPLSASALLGLAINPFFIFFPLIVIYIVNFSFARQRRDGTLEFLLVRPVTKVELLLSRFISTLTTVLISVLALVTITSAVLEIFKISLSAQVFLGVILSVYLPLMDLISLLFLIAVLAKGRFLAISLVVYVFLEIIYPIIILFLEFSGVLARSYIPYLQILTPIGADAGIADQINNTIPLYQLVISIISVVLWLAVPLVIAVRLYNSQDTT